MSNRPNVHVHEMALGDKNGMTRFHLNVGEQTNSLLDNTTESHSDRFRYISPKFRCKR